MFPFIASDGERCLVLGRDFCKCVKYNCIYVIVYIAKIRDYEKFVSDYPNLTAVSAACEILRIYIVKLNSELWIAERKEEYYQSN